MVISMSTGRLIEQRRKALGLTLEELGRRVGVGKSTVRKWETGFIENMRRDKIALLANALQIDASVLLGHDATIQPDAAIITRRIPLVGRIAAGQPITAQEDIEDWLIVDERDDVDFALRIKGDSMTGVGIYDGDIIYVRKQPTVNNGEIAVVLIDDGFPDTSEATCKRFYQYGKTVLLRPESHNPENKEREITLGGDINVTIQGKVIFLKSYIGER